MRSDSGARHGSHLISPKCSSRWDYNGNRMAYFRVMSSLILKHASASRASGAWDDDDFDVLTDGAVVGRIMKTAAAPVGLPLSLPQTQNG